jgi:hypothetical protein
VSTRDPTRVRKPAGERWRPGHRGDRACDSSWWSGLCSLLHATSGEAGDDAALEQQHRNEERDGHDPRQGCRHRY